MNTTIQVQGKPVYATPTGLKLGAKGKVTRPEVVMGMLAKGEARRLRKTLRMLGHGAKAAARRLPAAVA